MLSWLDIGFGPALAAIGNSASSRAGKLIIGSATTYDRIMPHASTPLLDPLCSSEEQDIIHFSSCVNRMQKIATIAYQAPHLLEHLRVCWENRKGSYNCRECEKCIRTIVALELCNSRSLTKTFPNVSTSTLLLNLKLPLNHNHLFYFWEDMLDYAKEQANPGLQQAIAIMLTRSKRRRNLCQVLKTFSRAAPKSLRARVSKALYN